ncbi:MAG: UDP-N-acetylmuramoyl-tripeptide--D-alanyl-D-alanine ligase [Acidobacteria bacterium]|nr:UDP-N-acetylmuramoyl-tripeptide--D-alanyl-D-alanine ligase [Acidobacteriota bacterium]
MRSTPAVLIWAALLASAAVAARRAVTALHMWQMDSYIVVRYLNWLRAKPRERFFDTASAALAVVLFAASFGLSQPHWVLLVWIAWCVWLLVRKQNTEAKKPLDFTERARRTLWVARGALVVTAVVIAWFACVPAAVAAGLCLLHAAPGAILLANVLLKPVQARINRGFVRAAAKRIADLNPVVIGVAGSYGKTSTKYFIDALLSERFRVIKSPGNFNTLLGITKVINTMIEPSHEVFIAEMGAYKRGEVKEIADLVHPRYGIISSIGPEHFERFLSMDNIERTNYELIEALPKDGLAVFNGENEHCRKMAGWAKHTRTALYGLGNARGDCDVWAEGVEHGPDGLTFTMVTREGGRAVITAPVVGRHMVLNVLGAARIAIEMGLTLEEIARGAAKLKSAPNRLELKKGAGGTIIIDDSYNSNPVGAAEALHVLSQFKTGRRILVTPGMIELGVLHHEKNEEFGYLAAGSCDFVILVGPEQTRPIQEGLRRGEFPEKDLRIVKELSEATAIFQKLLRPGDVLLFENDLPDLYTEK